MQLQSLVLLALLGISGLGCSEPPRRLDRTIVTSRVAAGVLWICDREASQFLGLELSGDYRAQRLRDVRVPFPCPRIRPTADNGEPYLFQCEDDRGELAELRSVEWPSNLDQEPSFSVVSEFPDGIGNAWVASDGTWMGESGDEIVFWDGTRITKPEGTRDVIHALWLGEREGSGVLTFDRSGAENRFVWSIRKDAHEASFGKETEMSGLTLRPVKDESEPDVVLVVEGRGSPESLHPERMTRMNLKTGSVSSERWPLAAVAEAREWFQTAAGLWGASNALDQGELFDLSGKRFQIFGTPKSVAVDQKGGRIFVLGERKNSSVTVVNLRRQHSSGESRPRASGVLSLPDGEYGDLWFSPR